MSLTELHGHIKVPPRFGFWCHRRPMQGCRNKNAIQQEIVMQGFLGHDELHIVVILWHAAEAFVRRRRPAMHQLELQLPTAFLHDQAARLAQAAFSRSRAATTARGRFPRLRQRGDLVALGPGIFALRIP